jgi:hypothetical protein
MSDFALLRLLAWINIVLHLLALLAAVLGMQPGSPLVSVEQRMAHLATQPLSWSLSWGVWALCALGLISFVAVATSHLPQRRAAGQLAVALVTAGAGADLLCDSVQILVLPMLAAEGPGATLLFLAFERAAGAGGLIAANGLYGLGTLVLTECLRGRPGAGPALALGWAMFVGAMLLVAAGFTGDAWQAGVATVPTILLFCVWALAVVRALGCSTSRP